MNKLKKYKFSELYDFSSGISTSPKQAGHGSPFVSFSTIFNNYFLPDELKDLMDTSDREQTTYSVKKGDILLTRTSETIDELGMSCVALKDYPKATYSGFAKRLRPLQNNITYDKFMGFYLRSNLFRQTMTNNAVLTLRASLNEDIFSYLELLLPEYKEQVKIGDLLYNINKKIDLNNKINQELEAISKTVFDYWFIQFDFPNEKGNPFKSSGGKMKYSKELKRNIPLDWEVKKLEDIILKTGTGLNPRDNFKLGNGNNFYVTIKNIEQGKVILDKKCDKIDDEALKIIDRRSDLQVGDILFTSIQPIGITYLIQEKPKNWNINESVFTIRPNNEFVSANFLFMLVSSDFMKVYTSNVSAGSIHKGIRHADLKSFKFPFPNKNILRLFDKKIKPLLKQMYLNEQQNQELSKLRDWLLPMLMNGQVSVK
jgi:type I restriction enzyme, S subunit